MSDSVWNRVIQGPSECRGPWSRISFTLKTNPIWQWLYCSGSFSAFIWLFSYSQLFFSVPILSAAATTTTTSFSKLCSHNYSFERLFFIIIACFTTLLFYPCFFLSIFHYCCCYECQQCFTAFSRLISIVLLLLLLFCFCFLSDKYVTVIPPVQVNLIYRSLTTLTFTIHVRLVGLIVAQVRSHVTGGNNCGTGKITCGG